MSSSESANSSASLALNRLGLAGIFGLAAALRSIGFERVFLSDGRVVFANSDAFYHARRALYTLAQYPDWLRFDSCLNYPDGAAVPHPPGYDFVVASLAQLGGGSVGAMETVAAWLPVLLGALTVFPVYALGRLFGGRAVGLGAALLVALMPIAVNYSQVGNADHHAAAGLLGASLLLLYATLLTRSPVARLGLCFVLLTLNRLAMLLVWHGSLLYLGLGEIVVLLLAAHDGRRDLLRGQALSCFGVAIFLLPIVAESAPPRDGAFAATELSGLHVLLFAAEAAACALLFRWLPSAKLAAPRARVLLALGLGMALGAVLLAVPGVLAALQSAAAFLAKSDQWGASVLEQLPLFYEDGGLSRAAGEKWMGNLAYLLPLLPLVFVPLLDDPGTRSRALLAIVWSLVFGVLAFSQVRYANDYAAIGCVAAALGIAQGTSWVSKRLALPLRLPLAIVLGVLLVAPTWPRYYSILLEASVAMAGETGQRDRALLSLEGTQLRFAQRVRELTPESVGCGPEPGVPEYGILAHPAIGHALHYVAGRATPADPFGPYIGQANFDALQRALRSTSEQEVVEIAEQLRSRYLLSAHDGAVLKTESVMQRLHRNDGAAEASLPQLGHFRLLAEGPLGGVPLSVLFEEGTAVPLPYKLFEIVPGALLSLSAPAGERVTAVVSVQAQSGRRFSYRAEALADTDGEAKLRVPYATGASGAAARGGPYTVVAGNRRWQVVVPEISVLEGRVVSVAEPGNRRD